MKTIYRNIQDSVKVKDTAKHLKLIKIVPALKIENSSGAIIPKEAITWTELSPAIEPHDKEKKPIYSSYIVIGIVLVIIFIFIKFLINKGKTKNKS